MRTKEFAMPFKWFKLHNLTISFLDKMKIQLGHFSQSL